MGALVIWLVIVIGSFGYLWKYKTTPGLAESAPKTWPVESPLERVAGVPTLVMFAHPLCPCSRASVAELGDLLRGAGPVTAHVLFLRPDEGGPDWEDKSLKDAAAAIPGVRVALDDNAAEARRFGAHTSGHVVIYGDSGQLLFSGGITGSRGHIGDNQSLEQAVAALKAGKAATGPSPVFGCCLRGHE